MAHSTQDRECDTLARVALGDRLEGCALEQCLETDPDLVGALVHLWDMRYRTGEPTHLSSDGCKTWGSGGRF